MEFFYSVDSLRSIFASGKLKKKTPSRDANCLGETKRRKVHRVLRRRRKRRRDVTGGSSGREVWNTSLPYGSRDKSLENVEGKAQKIFRGRIVIMGRVERETNGPLIITLPCVCYRSSANSTGRP